MNDFFSLLSGLIRPGTLLGVLLLVGLVIIAAFVMAKNRRAASRKPGMHLLYQVPGSTAAACRALLASPLEKDLFAYRLEAAPAGGWYMNFKLYRPTEQILDTLFLLQFEAEEPARFSLRFVREAFGVREPIIPEAMLDEFFLAKLGAVRAGNDESAP